MNQHGRPWLFEDTFSFQTQPLDNSLFRASIPELPWTPDPNVATNFQPYMLDLEERDSTQDTPTYQGVEDDDEDPSPPGTFQFDTCFGAIPNVMVRLRKTLDLRLSTPTAWRFDVAPLGQYYGLKATEDVFGIFSKKQCNAIQQLLAIDDVQLAAYVSLTVLARAFAAHTKQKPAVMPLELNVYGTREAAAKVGKILSSFEMYLQQPLFGFDPTNYYNPHFLHVRELSGEYVVATPILQMNLPTEGEELGRDRQAQRSQSQPSTDEEIPQIINSLSYATLQRHVADGRVKTILKNHQMEALDFMLRREMGNLPVETTLWEEMEDETGDSFYQHIICGARRDRPLDVRGGILADEMGLGKTIVSLSTIASSLARALEFKSGQCTKIDARAERQRSRATLVLVPSSMLLDGWIAEIYKHIYPGQFKYYKYHGQRRKEDIDQMLQSNIVLTTYATLASEASRWQNLLHSVEWFRIILDEAHDIRNRNTRLFKTVTSLAGLHRWCLTGTPIQNTLDDLGALVTFLKLPLLENAATFQRFIVNHGRFGSTNHFRNLRTLLESICLRRTKDIIGILDPVEEVRRLDFSASERYEYNQLLRRYESIIGMHVSGHGKGANTAKVQAFLRLRLFCNNGMFTADARIEPDEVLSSLQDIDQATCAYCSRMIYALSGAPEAEGGVLLSECFHLLCWDCIAQGTAQKNLCPTCSIDAQGSNAEHISSEGLRLQTGAQRLSELGFPLPSETYPTKLLALLNDIAKQTNEKSIVFSSWTKTLHLVSELLQCRNLPHYCIHGELSSAERKRILDDFQRPSSSNILLMTLGTGGVGINLAVASRIYLLEPQWNPAVEQQAFGRALRLGQTKQVALIRYIMKDSVEDSNVQSRQKTKMRLASGGFRGRGSEAEGV